MKPRRAIGLIAADSNSSTSATTSPNFVRGLKAGEGLDESAIRAATSDLKMRGLDGAVGLSRARACPWHPSSLCRHHPQPENFRRRATHRTARTGSTSAGSPHTKGTGAGRPTSSRCEKRAGGRDISGPKAYEDLSDGEGRKTTGTPSCGSRSFERPEWKSERMGTLYSFCGTMLFHEQAEL